jgi:hypothetical protein
MSRKAKPTAMPTTPAAPSVAPTSAVAFSSSRASRTPTAIEDPEHQNHDESDSQERKELEGSVPELGEPVAHDVDAFRRILYRLGKLLLDAFFLGLGGLHRCNGRSSGRCERDSNAGDSTPSGHEVGSLSAIDAEWEPSIE